MIRKDKITETTSDEALENVSSDVTNITTTHDLEERAIFAFSNTEDSEDK